MALGGGLGALAEPVPLAVLLGLVVGKQLGVFGAMWAVVALGIARKPDGASWTQLYGAAILCGIGFTMSLFIGGLAWPGTPELVDAAKIGTLGGIADCRDCSASSSCASPRQWRGAKQTAKRPRRFSRPTSPKASRSAPGRS